MGKSVTAPQGSDTALDYCLQQIKAIQGDYSTLQADRVKALKFYNSDHSIVPVVKNRSEATTTDLFDIIEWIKPSVLEIFTSNEEVVALQPDSEEDVQPVKRMELLVNKQLRQKNKWFNVIYDAFTDGMLLKIGFVKYQWFKETKYIDRDYYGLNELEYQAKINEPNFEVIESIPITIQEAQADEFGMMMKPAVMQYNIKGRYAVEDEYPLLEAVPPEDIGFKLNTRNLGNGFMYHRIKYNKYEFEKKYGKDITDKLVNSADDSSADSVGQERFADLGGTSFYYDKDKDEIIVYECFYPHTKTGEAWLTCVCGDEILLDEKNKYDAPPFESFSPIRISHRICGKSYYDLLHEIQRIRTGLLRQIIDNTYMSNYRRYFGDRNRIDMDAYYNNNTTNAFINVVGDVNTAIKGEDKAPLPPEVFNFFELMNVEKDYHSGVPRSFQGVNPDALNKTFRGQAQQVSQASQRIQLLARLMAETFVSPLVKSVINLNLKFLQKKTMVRYLNEWIEVNPDNIIGKYDMEIKVGLGTGNKDMQVSQLQQVLGLYGQIFKSGIGVVTSQNVYHTMKELLNAMGYRNTRDFVTDPNLIQDIQALIKLVMQAVQATGVQDPQIMGVVQKVMGAIGSQPQQEQISGKNFPGQNTPEQSEQPEQPMQHRGSAMDGGGFYS